MKKILLINDHDINGGAESVFHLQFDCFTGAYQVDKLIGEYFVKRNILNYIYSKKVEKNIYNLIVDHEYDIVQIHNYHHFFSPSLLKGLRNAKKKVSKLKVVYTAHDFHLVCPNSGCFYYENNKLKNFQADSPVWNYLINKIDNRSLVHNWLKKIQWLNAYVFHKYFSAIDHITTPSHFLKNFITAKHKLPVSVIRNPIDKNDNADDTKNYMQDGVLRIIFFGRLSVEKGILELVTQLAQIKNVPFTFTVFGDGPERGRIENRVTKFNLNDKVVFKGAVKRLDLLNELKNYDLFILPSLWYENAPMSIVEAANANLLIATSNFGGMVELTEATGGGFYFTPEDGQSLQRCLNEVVNFIKTGKTMANPRYEEDFSKENFYNRFNELYKSL